MGLRLSPIGGPATVMMVMMMMMTLLVRDAGVLAGRISGDVADDQLGTVAFGVVAATEIFPVSWFIQGLLATERRMAAACLVTGGHVQILPSLTVVTIKTAPALRGTAVETGDGVAIGRRAMTIVLAASSAVSAVKTKKTNVIIYLIISL